MVVPAPLKIVGEFYGVTCKPLISIPGIHGPQDEYYLILLLD